MFLLLKAQNPSTNQQILPQTKSSFTNSENTHVVSAHLNYKIMRQRSNCPINHICMCIYMGEDHICMCICMGEDLGGLLFLIGFFGLVVEGFFSF